jgi:hypothetical protein
MHWQQQIGKTPFKRINLEMILLHIIRSKHRIALQSLVKRLMQLEQQARSEPVYPHQTQTENLDCTKAPMATNCALPDQGFVPDSSVEAEVNLGKICETQICGEAQKMPEENVTYDRAEHKTAKEIPENSSLEETLLRKIKEKIDAAPSFAASDLEKQPSSETTIKEDPVFDPPQAQAPSYSSLLLSKTQWEALSAEGTSPTLRQEEPAATTFDDGKEKNRADEAEAKQMILETAVRDGKVMQDFEPESFERGDTHSRLVKGSLRSNDSGSKDCINLPSPTAVSRMIPPIPPMELAKLVNAADVPSPQDSPEDLESQILTTKPLFAEDRKLTEKASKTQENTPLPSSGDTPQSRYDTLIRFASVELEGVIKKESPNG